MADRSVKPIKYLFSVLMGIASAAGVFFSPILLIAPAFLGFIGAAWSVNCLVVALSSMAAVLLGLFGLSEPLFALVVLIPASIAIAVGVRNQKLANRSTVMLTSALLALGLYALLCAPGLIAGEGAFAEMKKAFELYKSAFDEAAKSMAFTSAQTDALNETFAVLSMLAPEITITSVIGPAMLFGFLDYIIARAMAKRAGVPVRGMAKLCTWELSKSQSLGSLILLLGALALSFLNIENVGALLVAVELIVFGPVFLMGVCFIEFLAKTRAKNSGAFRALIYIASVLLLPYSAVLYIILAFIDKVLRIRKRFFEAGDHKQD